MALERFYIEKVKYENQNPLAHPPTEHFERLDVQPSFPDCCIPRWMMSDLLTAHAFSEYFFFKFLLLKFNTLNCRELQNGHLPVFSCPYSILNMLWQLVHLKVVIIEEIRGSPLKNEKGINKNDFKTFLYQINLS